MMNPPEAAPKTPRAIAKEELSRKIETIKVESRHLENYVLTNEVDGSQWRPSENLRGKWTWKRIV